MTITIVQVSADQADQIEGERWATVLAAYPDGIRSVEYGMRAVERADGGPQPPIYCPKGCVWFREVKDRAVKYVSNR